METGSIFAPVTSRKQRLAYYGIPMLFCLAVHILGLRTWFYLDDFAWLGLRLEVHSFRDLLAVLFRPEAQGTVRTLSERLFFLIFSSLFGLEVAPFKFWVYLTQFANLVLLAQITRRLTGSAMAGFIAAILWAANPGLAIPLAWTSAYNEVASSFFILLAFRLFLEHIDTGRLKYWIWQWVVFLLGFGTLELNVVYPAIAAGYALCCARRQIRKTLYLFLPSIAFTAAHFVLISRPDAGPYKMYFGRNLWGTFWHYLTFALGAARPSQVDWRPPWIGTLLAITVLLVLGTFTLKAVRRHELWPLFTWAWFIVAILPVLPLKNHFTEYYVTVPTIGLAILSAWAIVNAHGRAVLLSAVLVAAYLTVAIADIHDVQKFYHEKARQIKHLLTAVISIEREHPGNTILVDGVDNDTYWLGFYGDPFRLIGVNRIYLVPGSEKTIDPHPEMGGISRFTARLEDVVPLLGSHQVVALRLQGTVVRDVTQSYRAIAYAEYLNRHPDFVDAGDPVYASRLGATWYQIEKRFRWMPRMATVTMGGPSKTGQVLTTTGYCPAAVAQHPGARVSVRADGTEIGSEPLAKVVDKQFTFKFPVPRELTHKASIEITIETNYTLLVGDDSRPLGLAFGTFRIE